MRKQRGCNFAKVMKLQARDEIKEDLLLDALYFFSFITNLREAYEKEVHAFSYASLREKDYH